MIRIGLSAALGAVLLPLGAGASAGTATAVDPPPGLVSITYIGPPYARVGWMNQPIAAVNLTGPAQGDTAVTVSSSAPGVAAVPGSVTVPDGQTSTTVPVSAFTPGTATLTAGLGIDSLVLEPALRVGGVTDLPNLSELTVSPDHVQPGESSTGTVVLDFLAPPGGTVVSLASSPAGAVTVPAQVVVPADADRATFDISTDGATATTNTITASLNDVVRSVNLTVADTIAPDTSITKVTVKNAKRRATVRFSADEAGASFRCRLDSGETLDCSSPRTYRHLSRGSHQVRVRAVDAVGNVDPSAAVATFRIKRR